MRPQIVEQFQFRYTTATEVGRVTYDADGILLEIRDVVRTFNPYRRVHWDEIDAIYCWSSPNWGLLAFSGVFALIVLLGGIAAGIEGGVKPGVLGAAAGIAAAIAGVGGFSAIRRRRLDWVKVATQGRPLVFPAAQALYVEALMARLPSAPNPAADPGRVGIEMEEGTPPPALPR